MEPVGSRQGRDLAGRQPAEAAFAERDPKTLGGRWLPNHSTVSKGSCPRPKIMAPDSHGFITQLNVRH